MKGLRLAFYFLLVPRLFASLIFFPLLLSIIVVCAQLFVTQVLIESVEHESASDADTIREAHRQSIIRQLLFGSGEPLPPPLLCRWVFKTTPDKTVLEVPPSKECKPDRLDAAIHVPDPATYDPQKYMDLLTGSFERVHICKHCRPDVVLTPDPENPRSDIYSVWGMGLLFEARREVATKHDFLDKLDEVSSQRNIIGDRYLYLRGMRGPINIKTLTFSLAVVMNLAGLIVVALWLALKAHRRVLDYFARSGALLPLVAASGKGTFYFALWLLTFFRVAAFICAAVPITIFGLLNTGPAGNGQLFNGVDTPEILLWILTISISLGFATLIASIADLQHRHHVMSFAYKFLPLVISMLGALVWGVTFIVDGPIALNIRSAVTGLPLLGMAPMLLAPIIKPKIGLLVIHALTTFFLIVVAGKINARWFAAHLEEL